MAEWYCPKCGRLNLSSENIAGAPAVCQNCRSSITYNPEIESLNEQKKGWMEDITESRGKIETIDEWLSDLYDEIGSYESNKTSEQEIIADARNEIKKIEMKIQIIEDKMQKKQSFNERINNLDVNQQKLEVFS